MAICHFEVVLEVASSFGWHGEQFWGNHSLAKLFFDEGRLNDAHTHIERTKSHTTNYPYYLGSTMELQARFWYWERRFEEAKSGALDAVTVYEKIGATVNADPCIAILRDIERAVKDPITPHD